jgi:hypothetical protein
MALKPISQVFMDEVVELVDKFRDQGVTYTDIIGCLEIMKFDIYSEMQVDEDEEDRVHLN